MSTHLSLSSNESHKTTTADLQLKTDLLIAAELVECLLAFTRLGHGRFCLSQARHTSKVVLSDFRTGFYTSELRLPWIQSSCGKWRAKGCSQWRDEAWPGRPGDLPVRTGHPASFNTSHQLSFPPSQLWNHTLPSWLLKTRNPCFLALSCSTILGQRLLLHSIHVLLR